MWVRQRVGLPQRVTGLSGDLTISGELSPSSRECHMLTYWIVLQSNLSKWIMLKWITCLNECHLSGPV